MKVAWPACCRQSEITLTIRTPSVTGGSQASSTTRVRSASVILDTSRDGLLVHRVVVPGEQIRQMRP